MEGFERYSSDPTLGAKGRCDVLGIESSRGFLIFGHVRVDPPGYNGWPATGWQRCMARMSGNGPIGLGSTRRLLGVIYWNNTINAGPSTGTMHPFGVAVPWVYVAAPFTVAPLLLIRRIRRQRRRTHRRRRQQCPDCGYDLAALSARAGVRRSARVDRPAGFARRDGSIILAMSEPIDPNRPDAGGGRNSDHTSAGNADGCHTSARVGGSRLHPPCHARPG